MRSDALLRILPGIYQNRDKDGGPSFLENYLKILQFILLSVEEKFDALPQQKGVGEILDVIKNLFSPGSVFYGETSDALFQSYFSADREEFLQWLAGWFAFVLDEDWEYSKKIKVLSNIVPLYRKRGTKDGLRLYLELYQPGGSSQVEIIDSAEPFCLQDPQTTPPEAMQKLGENTILGGLPSHFFMVNVSLPTPDPEKMKEQYMAVKKIIDREKPVHTYYRINLHAPVMLVGVKDRCRLGVDTYLGDKYTGDPVKPADFLS